MDKKTLESVADEALDAFWNVVAMHSPESKTGDLSPRTTYALHQTAEAAIGEWVRVHCKTCGSEIVDTINDSHFHDGECGACEHLRYQSQPMLLNECRIQLENWQMLLSGEWDGSSSGIKAAIDRLQSVTQQSYGTK